MILPVMLRSSMVVALLLMLPTGCGDPSSTARSKQAETEARQQAEQARRESEERRDRLHTLRIVAFVALAGGAVAVIAWAGQAAPRSVFDRLARPLPEQRPANLPRLTNDPARPRGEGRIIELPPQLRSPGAAQPAATPSAPLRQPRRRKNNQPPGNRRP